MKDINKMKLNPIMKLKFYRIKKFKPLQSALVLWANNNNNVYKVLLGTPF